MSNRLGIAIACLWCIAVGLSDLIFSTTASPYVLILGGAAVLLHVISRTISDR